MKIFQYAYIDFQVVGWGLTENKISSDVLLSANLPYIDYDTCFREASRDFKKYITYDKFCAGYKNGNTNCTIEISLISW